MNLKFTTGELVFLQRRRQGLTQREWGALRAMTWRQVSSLEEQTETGDATALLGAPTLSEQLIVRRRREKWNRDKLAKRLRCSKRWLLLMELGRVKNDKLVAFWERHDAATTNP